MFEFLFKRNEPAKPAASQPDAQARPADSAPQTEALRRKARTLAEEAIASSDAADEQALADFIASCDDAEARRIAAEAVQTRPMLTRVRQSVLHTDRRVARLMQTRLDQLDREERLAEGALRCIERARELLDAPAPGAMQVAELERQWQALSRDGATPPAPLVQRFQTKLAALSQRLRAQADLQRAVLDALAGLRGATQNVAELVRTGEALDSLLGAAEAPSLPRRLLADVERARAQAEAARSRAEALTVVTVPVPELVPGEAVTGGAPESPPDDAIAAQAPTSPPEATVPAAKRKPAFTPADEAAHAALLTELEHALDQGLLQQAERHDKRLRGMPAVPRHAARLAELRAELARLSAWARWGGNVSREELAKAAEDLAAQPVDARELARRIAALRAHWKELDAHAGHAPKALWERFDTACSAAYAPAAAHFAQQAQARKANAEAAQALVAQAEVRAAAPGEDWKDAAAFVQQCEAAWRRLGPVDRKEKKALEARLDTALNALRAPLDEARRAETRRREDLIAQAEALQAGDRGAPDRLRQLQASWQDGARHVPLARRDEQALWQRFRAACDAVFAQRRHAAGEADGVRRAALTAATALCERLEQAGDVDAALRDARHEWQAVGELPRAQAAAVTQRYKNAVAALERRRSDAHAARLRERRKALDEKLMVCAALDAALAAGETVDEQAWRARWDALVGAAPALSHRFEAALAAASAGRDDYVAHMQAGAARFEHDLLRLEIMAGQPSPPERQAARLQVQVEVLRQSLRDGQGATAAAALRDALYATPCASVDAADRLRAAGAALAKEGG